MKTSEKIRALISRLREKHKLTFSNDTNYHERWSFRVSALNLYSLLLLYTIVIVIGVMVLITYTGLGGFVSRVEDSDVTIAVEENARQLDSLYQMTLSTEKYLNDLQKLLKGESFGDSIHIQKRDSSLTNYMPDFSRSAEDSILRAKMENQTNLDVAKSNEIDFDFFFPPVNGTVSQSFLPVKNHFGVDVVTMADEPVKACLDGTAVVAGWFPGEGNILIVQHNNDLISVYKHCSVLLKKQGDKILTGDPIGIVGNTGENTSGPHLHFELWKKGVALNPQEFISF